jgi:hypothetical protein
MRLWEFVIQADDDLDLANPAKGEKWFRASAPATPLGAMPVPDDREQWPRWSTQEGREWREAIIALRSIVRRTTTVRPRRPAPTGVWQEREADKLWHEYLLELSPQIVNTSWKVPGRSRLSLGRHVEVHLRPTMVAHPVYSLNPGKREYLSQSFGRGHVGVFLSIVFGSLVQLTQPPVCKDCGVLFDTVTPRGRLVRRTICRRCTERKRYAKRDRKWLQEKWVRASRKRRKKLALLKKGG